MLTKQRPGKEHTCGIGVEKYVIPMLVQNLAKQSWSTLSVDLVTNGKPL